MNSTFTGTFTNEDTTTSFTFTSAFIIMQLNRGVAILIRNEDLSEAEVEAFGYTGGFKQSDLTEEFMQLAADSFTANFDGNQSNYTNEFDVRFNDRTDLLSNLAKQALTLIHQVEVLIFAGSEGVDGTNITRCVWSEEGLIDALSEQYTDWNNNAALDNMFDSDVPTGIHDTIHIVNDNFAQGVHDANDGGMVYIVRVPTQ